MKWVCFVLSSSQHSVFLTPSSAVHRSFVEYCTYQLKNAIQWITCIPGLCQANSDFGDRYPFGWLVTMIVHSGWVYSFLLCIQFNTKTFILVLVHKPMRIPYDRYSLQAVFSWLEVSWTMLCLISTYSIHVNRGVHATFPGMAAAAVDDADPLRGNHMDIHLGKRPMCPPIMFFFFFRKSWLNANSPFWIACLSAARNVVIPFDFTSRLLVLPSCWFDSGCLVFHFWAA